MSKLLRLTKYLSISLVVLVVFIILANLIFERIYTYPAKIKFGVTFSPSYARYLKLDWEKTYIRILDELKVTNLRIPSYWNSLEPEEQQNDFSETDFMLDEASKRGVKVILVVGARQPRWPECQYPFWAKKKSLGQRQQATLQFVQKVVERYKSHEVIWAWQVENEPFAFWFGENCDPPDKKFLQEEVKLVKMLDNKRAVIVTDSGEWGSWVDSLQSADILGISVYRKSYNQSIDLYTTYPFLPGMYQLKAALIKALSGNQNKQVIVTELQVEPWVQKAIPDTALEQQTRLFTPQDFKDIIQYTQKTGFDEAYLWGVEWWYWMDKQGYPQYLDFAKQLF